MEVRLSREMRLIDVTMIGVGAMIGAGIFVLTGIAAGVAGPALLLVFLLNGLVATLTAAAYAELGGAIHGAGGGYLWIKRALPDPSGFLSGWMDWFAHAVACSLYALGFGAYFKELLAVVGVSAPQTPIMPVEVWAAIGACSLFAYINYRGASEAGKAGSVVTISKVVIIGAFIVAGLWAMAHRTGWQGAFTPFFSNGLGGVFAAMGLTFIAFEGYEIIAQTSEEVEDPKRNVPRAVFLSLLIVVPIYLLVAFVAIGAVIPPAGVAVTAYLGAEKEVALVAAANQFIVGGGIVILVGGLLSTLSALNATIYSSSRVAFAMARDASLPSLMASVHPRTSTPHFAILVSTLLIILMAVSLPIEEVAAAASVMFLLLFGGVNLAVIRLRKLHPELDRGYKVPFVPVTPVLAIVSMLAIAVMMFVAYPQAWAAAGGWIALGLVFYYAYSRKRETAFSERTAWMERIERKEYRVLVAVSSDRTMESLMEAGLLIASEHQGSLVVVSVIEVPDGERLLAGRKRVRQAEAALERAVKYAEKRGMAARPVVKISRRISHGIVETVREEGCNFLIIGQPDITSFLERIVASIVERVLKDVPCQVGVVYGTIVSDSVNGIVVPVTKGRNAGLAAQLAPAFGRWFEVKVRAMTVVESDAADDEAEKAVGEAQGVLTDAGVDIHLEVLRRREVAVGLARAIKRGNLVVIGAPSSGPVAAIVGETIPMTIGNRGRNPVVVVRDVEPRRVHRFERLFFGRT
jgi:amino acid transporter/nucleotide-binding universal stress UspA family protein